MINLLILKIFTKQDFYIFNLFKNLMEKYRIFNFLLCLFDKVIISLIISVKSVQEINTLNYFLQRYKIAFKIFGEVA